MTVNIGVWRGWREGRGRIKQRHEFHTEVMENGCRRASLLRVAELSCQDPHHRRISLLQQKNHWIADAAAPKTRPPESVLH